MNAAVVAGAAGLRPVTSSDLPVLRQVFHEVHGEQFAGSGLPAELLVPLLDLQFRSQQAQYGHEHPEAEDSLIELDGHPVGRCWIDRSSAAFRILDLAVLPSARRRGIASRVLSALAEEAAEAGRCLHLSVWRDNVAARSLYEGLGFGLRQESSDGYLELCWSTAAHSSPPTTPPREAETR